MLPGDASREGLPRRFYATDSEKIAANSTETGDPHIPGGIPGEHVNATPRLVGELGNFSGPG